MAPILFFQAFLSFPSYNIPPFQFDSIPVKKLSYLFFHLPQWIPLSPLTNDFLETAGLEATAAKVFQVMKEDS